MTEHPLAIDWQHPLEGNARHVAIVAAHYVHADGRICTGGAEKYLLQTISALLSSGVRVHVGYSGTSIYDELLAQVHPTRLTVECTNWLSEKLSGDARLQLKIISARRRWLRATGADTFLAVQQAGGGAFGASLIAAKTLGLRIVASIRESPSPLPSPLHKCYLGIIPRPGLWRQRLIWRKRLPAWCCDALIFNSRRIADTYASEYGYPQNRFCIIPNGEQIENEPCIRTMSTACHIASVGRVTTAKGADLLLEAFSLVAGRHPGTRLTYYGDGPLIPDLQDRARALGLQHRVRFPGYVADRNQIYSDIDIYVQPSRREAMSNSVVEAMACGIPCVVSDAGGLPETVLDGETGFVVPTNQPQAYAEAIGRLLSEHETYARFSRASGERAATLFNLRRVMRETVETILGASLGTVGLPGRA